MPIQLPWTILKFRSKSTGGNRTGNGLHMFRRRNEESVADDAVQTSPAMVRQVRRHRRNSQPTSSREALETTGDASSKVVRAALEGEWICQQRKNSHDSFISYRVAVHAHIVSAVHSAICEADSSHHMFWDKLCLVSADEVRAKSCLDINITCSIEQLTAFAVGGRRFRSRSFRGFGRFPHCDAIDSVGPKQHTSTLKFER
ncbi:hypothetical protein BJ741DRAFT_117856 [Chytriomyces cf. hyalinus JEL632]|nr:hypothetical protein BJ741DRAFT_117856 [Chytriomyces cf. hyalinus JEL632]